MNRKFEEKLAQLAFGDLNPEEAKTIESRAATDPDSARNLATYHAMRAGLKDLADVPEDQMSKERLRQAILAQGLKPEPARSAGFGWLWMPVAAAGLAVAMVLMRPHSQATTTVAIDSSAIPDQRVALNPPSEMPDLHTSVLGAPPMILGPELLKSGPTPAETSNVQDKTQEHRAYNHSARHADREDIREAVIYASMLDPQGPPIHVATTSQDQPGPSEPTPDASAPAPDSADSDKHIVMIDDNRDSSTGAMKAREVGASNVLIGG